MYSSLNQETKTDGMDSWKAMVCSKFSYSQKLADKVAFLAKRFATDTIPTPTYLLSLHAGLSHSRIKRMVTDVYVLKTSAMNQIWRLSLCQKFLTSVQKVLCKEPSPESLQ